MKDEAGIFVPLLQVLFIGLKLTGYINWPWWQVLLPIEIGAIIVILASIFAIYTMFMDR